MSEQRTFVRVSHSVASARSGRLPVRAPAARPPVTADDPWDLLMGELDDVTDFIELSVLLIGLLGGGHDGPEDKPRS